jgi:hypothetical protein
VAIICIFLSLLSYVTAVKDEKHYCSTYEWESMERVRNVSRKEGKATYTTPRTTGIV